jgi:quinolinate synthase
MKRFYPASDKMVCEHMKLTRLGDVRAALSELKNVVQVPEEVRIRAKKTVDRMLAVPRD